MQKKIVFFLPLVEDSRFTKRIAAFHDCGYSVQVFSFIRDYYSRKQLNFQYTSLGKISHGKYFKRIFKMVYSLWAIWRNKKQLEHAKCFYVFGLDTAVLVVLISKLLDLRTALVYEVADIRAIMLGMGLKGKFLRWLERLVLKEVTKLVVTSPAFRDEYFLKWQAFRDNKVYVLENKLYPPVPAPRDSALWDGERPLVIGYFGLLRCQKSWDVLVQLASEYPNNIQVYIRGYVFDIQNFEEGLAKNNNILYDGPYVSPDELAEIYSRIDICWLVHAAGHPLDAKWSLANRLYESIHYNVPIIVQKDSEMCKKVEAMKCGWYVDVFNINTIRSLIEGLEPSELKKAKEMCMKVPEQQVVCTKDHLMLIEEIENQYLNRTR